MAATAVLCDGMDLTSLSQSVRGIRSEMRLFSALVVLMLMAGSAICQPYGDSKYKVAFNKADALIYKGSFVEALPLLEGIHSSDSTIANINFMLGTCHLNGTKDYLKAVRYLENASRDVSKDFSEADWKERKAPGLTFLYLGRAYHMMHDFDRAVSNYYNYRSFISIDDVDTYNKVKMVIKHAENAAELIKNPVKTRIINLGNNVNTPFPDYAPVISADGSTLIFTSRRPGGISESKDSDGNYFDDIYFSSRAANGSWGRPVLLGGTINTPGHDAAIGLSPDGQTLFLYKDDNGDGNIYFSELKGAEWSVPEKLGSDINSGAQETHVTISHDADMLIFSSSRSGGYGGKDLWFSVRLPDGTWGLAQNMGSKINTSYDEESPFLAFDGKTLFFSSQGHSSMGGFDIFRSELIDGAWTDPENIGYPINTADDDIFFVLAADGKTAYFSSRRDGGLGDTDLYTLTLDPKRAEIMVVARGQMLIPANDYVKLGAAISVLDSKGYEVGTFRPNRNTGYYILLLNPGQTYSVVYRVEGYDPVKRSISVESESAYNQISRPVDVEIVVFGEELLAIQKQKKAAEEAAAAAKAKAEEDARLAEEARLKAEKDELERSVQLAREEEKRKEVERAESIAKEETELALAEMAEAEAKARAAAEQKAREEAEQVRLAEDAAKKEAEAKARAAAELKAKEEAEQTQISSNEVKNEEAQKREALQKRLEELKQKKAETQAALEQEREIALQALEQKQQELLQSQITRDETQIQPTGEAVTADNESSNKPLNIGGELINGRTVEESRTNTIVGGGEASGEEIASAAENDISEMIARNKRLISENESLREQLEEMNAKLDQILAELKARNELDERPLEVYNDDVVTALESGKKLILQNILFDYNKARLRGSSESELMKLADFLKENDDISITVSGHTDAKGDPDYNMRLSRARAEAVVSFLVSKGVRASRLKAEGFGQTRPIARNVNPNGQDNPIGRQLNRRIEISVTSGDPSLIETREEIIPEEIQVTP